MSSLISTFLGVTEVLLVLKDLLIGSKSFLDLSCSLVVLKSEYASFAVVMQLLSTSLPVTRFVN